MRLEISVRQRRCASSEYNFGTQVISIGILGDERVVWYEHCKENGPRLGCQCELENEVEKMYFEDSNRCGRESGNGLLVPAHAVGQGDCVMPEITIKEQGSRLRQERKKQ